MGTKDKNWSYITSNKKRYNAVKLLGGKCIKCGEDRFWVLDFHHIDGADKTSTINGIRHGRWSIISEEIQKCELLCANCHGEEHSIGGGRNAEIKRAFINEHNLTECESCGYDLCIGSLDFHHNSNDKLFGLSQAFKRQVSATPEEILTEINKCSVLCRNCHRDIHFDKERYETHKDAIENGKIREVQGKIDRQEVQDMLDSGMKQIEIARHYNASKGTISGIVKELKKKAKEDLMQDW